MIPVDVIEAGPDAVRRFERCVANGDSPRLAEMLALRSPPKADTDTAGMAGRKKQGMAAQFGPQMARQIANATYKKHGIKVSIDSTNYNPTAADYTGDPRAYYDQSTGEMGRMEAVRLRREQEYQQKKEREAKAGLRENPVHVQEEVVSLVRQARRERKKRAKGEVFEQAAENVKRKRGSRG